VLDAAINSNEPVKRNGETVSSAACARARLLGQRRQSNSQKITCRTITFSVLDFACCRRKTRSPPKTGGQRTRTEPRRRRVLSAFEHHDNYDERIDARPQRTRPRRSPVGRVENFTPSLNRPRNGRIVIVPSESGGGTRRSRLDSRRVRNFREMSQSAGNCRASGISPRVVVPETRRLLLRENRFVFRTRRQQRRVQQHQTSCVQQSSRTVVKYKIRTRYIAKTAKRARAR